MFFARTTTALLFSLGLLGGVVLGANELRIHNASELITFSSNVNNGANYSGTTVYLDSDIVFDSSLSSQFQSIGNSVNYFHGAFDGQGHTISGLALNSSSDYVGLFGYRSEGRATIKNLVLDGSYSFVNSRVSLYADVGSVYGYCYPCIIENVVNMASVTFAGNVSSNAWVGGMVGRLLGSSTIKNCVNYGTVTYSGTSSGEVVIGGIVGFSGGTSVKFIQNCASYGTITNNGELKNLKMGGLVGYAYTETIIIENCANGGKIMNLKQASESNYIGSVVGYISSRVTAVNITHCLWTSDVGYNDIYGYNRTKVTVTNSSHKELNTETVDGLNEYAGKNSTSSNWLILHLNGGRINNLNQETLIVTQKHFPDPVKEGYTFSFWCLDNKCDERYDPQTTNISEITDLYAAWNGTYTTTFYFGNGTTLNKILNFGEAILYPENPTKEGYTFNGWSPRPARMPATDVTVTAQWAINNYTITFVFNNGVENEVRTFQFNETIVYPEDPTKEGYTFNGWSPKPERMPAKDVTVTAQWIEKPTEFVEIVLSKKDLKEEEIKEIIREYTNEEFVIVKANEELTEGTKVVIKFTDVETAERFCAGVTKSRSMDNWIARVSFVDGSYVNSNSLLCPLLLNCIFM